MFVLGTTRRIGHPESCGACSRTGLRSLRSLAIRGAAQVGEEHPGALNAILQGMTSLYLRGQGMACHDIASPTLSGITLIFPATTPFPGVSSMPRTLPVPVLQARGHPTLLSLSVSWNMVRARMPGDMHGLCGTCTVGECPQLRTLLHSSGDVTAQQLNRFPKLQSLSDLLCAALPLTLTLVRGLTDLRRLQHLHLTQCAPPPCFFMPEERNT